MAYVPLTLACPNKKVAAAISMATERHLEQVHFLLAMRYSNESFHGHFGTSAAVMTLLTVAATSAIRYFDPIANKNKKPDRESFIECVEEFFPGITWGFAMISTDPLANEGKSPLNNFISYFGTR
jgi:hypothetical protein